MQGIAIASRQRRNSGQLTMLRKFWNTKRPTATATETNFVSLVSDTEKVARRFVEKGAVGLGRFLEMNGRTALGTTILFASMALALTTT